MAKKNKTEVVSLRLDEKLKGELDKLAKECRRDFADYVRLVLEDAVKNKVKV